MTKVTISGNANGTGNVNFAAPNTNSAITVTLPTSNVDMDSLGPSTSIGEVGTYGLFATTTNVDPGSTTSGSNMKWTNAKAYSTRTSPTISGTWRAMGGPAFGGDFGISEYSTTSFVRIS